ncbi:hypothetical protein ACFYPB_06035 [Streptomyces olivaceoviridis]|uniref:hypothetical protein n=1 Tax=Streptomyces olivaceoviridis TaxID=1921 RepID=UPI0036846803
MSGRLRHRPCAPTEAAGGNPPDVLQNAVTFLGKYDKRGIHLDLKSQVQAGNLSLDHFREGVTKVGKADLAEWWTDGCNRVKAGHVTDPKVVSQELCAELIHLVEMPGFKCLGHVASPPSRTWPCSATRCRSDREWGSAVARAAALAPPV